MTSGFRLPGPVALLVSVSSAVEAEAALDGGAGIIDAKDPTRGALGAVRHEVLVEIHAAVRGRAPMTAALGDAHDVHRIERLAAEFSERGASLVKVGFAGIVDARRVDALLTAAVRGCALGDGSSGVIAVAYADAAYVPSIDAESLVDVAARSGTRGVLIDTADKSGPGLTSLWTPDQIARWVADARSWGLLAAVAGKIGAEDFAVMRDAGADIVGVRGAACDAGRTGAVSADRVRLLRASLDAGVYDDALLTGRVSS